MTVYLQFSTRAEFRDWLIANCLIDKGVWLLFGKPGGPKTLRADEALEEALCFGWIDGKMQSLDDIRYLKYFSIRRKHSKWSEKNKALVAALEKQGIMTDYGRVKIEEAKKSGQWDAPKPPAMTDEHVANLSSLLKGHEPACMNFLALSPSVQKTYARAYYDAKTDEGKNKRLAWMIDRLNRNLRPM